MGQESEAYFFEEVSLDENISEILEAETAIVISLDRKISVRYHKYVDMNI